jgi:putative transcriptional regulator
VKWLWVPGRWVQVIEKAGEIYFGKVSLGFGGGIRKVRVAAGSKGKRGGARIICYWAMRSDLILLLYAFRKNATADLTPNQVKQLAKLVKEEFGDEKRNVEELLGSVREGCAILRGQKEVSRRTVIPASVVRGIREKTSLSQSEIAGLIGVSVKTLQNWEQARRRPAGLAAALLRIIEHDPVMAVRAIHRL